jgi:hypothetical protein
LRVVGLVTSPPPDGGVASSKSSAPSTTLPRAHTPISPSHLQARLRKVHSSLAARKLRGERTARLKCQFQRVVCARMARHSLYIWPLDDALRPDGCDLLVSAAAAAGL